ncbi:sarcosine oxidase subunit delta [Parasphingorhabdus pacifica]
MSIPVLPRQSQGALTEWWNHQAGCRCWFTLRRDTTINDIFHDDANRAVTR